MNVREQTVRVWRPEGFEGLEIEAMSGGPSFRPPTLIHAYSFQLVVSGHATVHYRRSSQSLKINQPTFAVQDVGEIFSYEQKKDDKAVFTQSFEVDPVLIRRVATELGAMDTFHFPELLIGNKLGKHLVRLAAEAFESFRQPTSQLERESYLYGLLSKVIEHCSDTPLTKRRSGKEHRAVTLVKDYLRENYGGNPMLDTLAYLAELNKTYLLEVFKREVGISPHGYLTCVRVGHAKNLLHKGLPIAQVAYASGFADQSHLNRVFKKYVLVTPGQYRRDSTYRSTFEQPQVDDAAYGTYLA